MIRRPPRSTLDRSSAASDVYKRQVISFSYSFSDCLADEIDGELSNDLSMESKSSDVKNDIKDKGDIPITSNEDIFGDEQAFPFIAGLGKNAAH